MRILIIGIIVVVVVSFMTTYTVRFTETAVVTTFGRADETTVRTEPGLKFRLPFIQGVTKYDNRARYIESRPETQQTADDSQIIVTSYLTWRVSDPLVFYQRFRGAGDRSADHYRAAESILQSRLRSATGVISRYRMNEILASRPENSRLAQLETELLEALERDDETGAGLARYGIEPVSVGLTRIKLPEGTTQEVFASMSSTRERIANETLSRGNARAEAIRASAEADARRLTAFAERLAQQIRQQGDIEAAEYLARMNVEPHLAMFLKNIDFIREVYGKQTTLVLSTQMPGFELFQPDVLAGLERGQIPVPKLFDNDKPLMRTARIFAGDAHAAAGAAGNNGETDGDGDGEKDDTRAGGN